MKITRKAFDTNSSVAQTISRTFSNYNAEILNITKGNYSQGTVINYWIFEQGTFMYPLETGSDEAGIQNFTKLQICIESTSNSDWIHFSADDGEFDASYALNDATEESDALVILQFLINETHEEIPANIHNHYAAFIN